MRKPSEPGEANDHHRAAGGFGDSVHVRYQITNLPLIVLQTVAAWIDLKKWINRDARDERLRRVCSSCHCRGRGRELALM
jgi:hypothetical protein